MSWFIKLLKCILCVEDEEREESRNWSRSYEYRRLSSADRYSSTTLAYSPLRSQSNFAKTTTCSGISNKLYENSVNSPSIPNRESIQSNSVPGRDVFVKSSTTAMFPCNKIPVVSSSASRSSAKTKANASSISEKSVEVPLRPNHVLSSLSSADALSTIKGNEVISKLTKQSSPNNVISDSSQRSQPSHDLPAYVYPPSVIAKPTLSSVSEKSKPAASEKPSQYSRKSKDLPLSTSGDNVHKSTTEKSKPTASEKPSQYSWKPKDLPLSPSDVNVHESITDHKLCSDICSDLSKPLQSSPKLPVSNIEKQSPALKKDPPPSALPQSPKPPPISTKPTLSPLLSSSTSQQKKNDYVWVEKSGSTTYVFPEDIKSLIEKDIVPGLLKMPLSPSTYKDYFHALLYAEDCHLEKWEGFKVKNVILELQDATIYTKKGKSKRYQGVFDEDERVFVTFDIDKILERQSPLDRKYERRPFLLSRDFVSVKPTDRKMKPFKGVLYRVVKSSLILADFGEDFHSQHVPGCEYDVKFSFNRICLKRAHHAIAAATDTLYRNFLFPEFAPKQEIPSTDLFVNYRYQKEAFAVWQILRLQSAPPYLVEGPLSVVGTEHLSRTAFVIVGAVLRICQKSPSNKVLLCASLNSTCDELMIALMKQMDESDMFRANAAFREIDGVPVDILPSCLYKEENDCFACPSLEELKKYKVISSTFMSSFRLRDQGMLAGHFSHIFLVDASSVTEPEAMVPLSNFATSKTIVVVTGAPRNHSGWVRSQIARRNGLMTSYFERLRQSMPYRNLDPRVITQLEDGPQILKEISKCLSSFLDHVSLF